MPTSKRTKKKPSKRKKRRAPKPPPETLSEEEVEEGFCWNPEDESYSLTLSPAWSFEFEIDRPDLLELCDKKTWNKLVLLSVYDEKD